MSPCDRLRWPRYVRMTSPMFTLGFSFGMVSPLEGVAYSLTVGVARGNFRRVVPIRYWPGKSPKPRPGINKDEQKEKGEPQFAFSERFPELPHVTPETTFTFALAPRLPAAAGGTPALSRSAPLPADRA